MNIDKTKFPLDKAIEKLHVRAVSNDGGTAYAEAVADGEDGWQFFIDGRKGSETAGELFTEYPDDERAQMIDPASVFSVSVKTAWESRNYDSSC